MWISRHISKSADTAAVQTGKSTLNSNGSIEAVANGAERDLVIYSPYGYAFSLPAGVDMLLTKCGGAQAGAGTLMNSSGLESGEIKISAKSGAYIKLCSDGGVIINGLRINKNGVAE